MDRAPDYGSVGWGFDSSWARHPKIPFLHCVNWGQACKRANAYTLILQFNITITHKVL